MAVPEAGNKDEESERPPLLKADSQENSGPGMPAPGGPDEDLSSVLGRLMTSSTRKTEAGRRRLANDPLTREYLEAGMRLLASQLLPGPKSESDELERPFFDWVSRRAVIAEVPNGASGWKGGEGTLRDRWPFHADYVEDLLSYVVHCRHWHDHVLVAGDAKEQLVNSSDFPAAVHETAYADLEAIFHSAANPIQLIATAVAAKDPVARNAVLGMYDMVTAVWRELYKHVLDAKGLKLRPGLSLEDFTYILTATADGLAMRLIVEPEGRILDRERRTSLLGTAALAMFLACVDHVDDGQSLEDLARQASP
jgi:hypothetical protein